MPYCVSSPTLFYVVLLLIIFSLSNTQLQEVELQQQNNTGNHNTAISPFLMKLKAGQNRQRRARLQDQDCWLRPWICREGLPPFVSIFCCRNRCVNVSWDPDNCGFCGIRCPFGWTCCQGICVDTMVNPFHCGECNRECRFPYPCQYGMCGYAETIIPHPHPHLHPKFPEPPFPPGEESNNKALGLHKMEQLLCQYILHGV